MARESAEGQRSSTAGSPAGNSIWAITTMSAWRKTCWYTVIAPLRIGVICGAPAGSLAPLEDELTQLIELGFLAGIAFQIHDDLLNLEADENLYGKETSGDLWEGKRTIMLLHFLRTVAGPDRELALALLGIPRSQKRIEDIAWLLAAMTSAGSLAYRRQLAIDFSRQALSGRRGLPFFRTTTGDSCVKC